VLVILLENSSSADLRKLLEAVRVPFTERDSQHAQTHTYSMYRVGQNHIYKQYMTVYLIPLPSSPYMHCIYVVLTNPFPNKQDKRVHARLTYIHS